MPGFPRQYEGVTDATFGSLNERLPLCMMYLNLLPSVIVSDVLSLLPSMKPIALLGASYYSKVMDPSSIAHLSMIILT